MAYRIRIWSGREARLVDHDLIDARAGGDAVLDRIADAGRASLGLPPRSASVPGSKLAVARRHLCNAMRLIEEL
jgi:hypothetical protein